MNNPNLKYLKLNSYFKKYGRQVKWLQTDKTNILTTCFTFSSHLIPIFRFSSRCAWYCLRCSCNFSSMAAASLSCCCFFRTASRHPTTSAARCSPSTSNTTSPAEGNCRHPITYKDVEERDLSNSKVFPMAYHLLSLWDSTQSEIN